MLSRNHASIDGASFSKTEILYQLPSPTESRATSIMGGLLCRCTSGLLLRYLLAISREGSYLGSIGAEGFFLPKLSYSEIHRPCSRFEIMFYIQYPSLTPLLTNVFFYMLYLQENEREGTPHECRTEPWWLSTCHYATAAGSCRLRPSEGADTPRRIPSSSVSHIPLISPLMQGSLWSARSISPSQGDVANLVPLKGLKCLTCICRPVRTEV